jgi:hypothetical protein
MLENIKYATISNIYVKNLIFYDSQKTNELKKMCADYGITYLPSKNRTTCYKLVGDKFIPSEIPEDLKCNPFDRLFDSNTIDKFESGNHDEVLFVVEDDKIKGVVHIVDYNIDFINYEFYKATYLFEKMLRELLLLKNESNDSLLEWMKEKSLKNNHWKTRYEQCVPNDINILEEQQLKRRDCNPFQTFFLNDLLYFVASKKHVSKEFRQSLDAIKNIRNWVAHNKDLTHKSQIDNNPLYKIEELKDFVVNAKTFFKCYEELEMGLNN